MIEATPKLPLIAERSKMVVEINPTSLITASKDLLFCELSDGAVILALKSGVYYGLDAVGTRVWGLIQQPTSVAEIVTVLLNEYDVERDRCKLDLQALLQSMSSLGLIEINDEAI